MTTVEWGTPYMTDPAYLTPAGLVWMRCKSHRIRYFDEYGAQVGPEQENLTPAVAYAHALGWRWRW